MKTRRNTFGRGCFVVGLAALYALVGMRAYVSWRDGAWLFWPLGDQLPDVVVRRVFSLEASPVRSLLVWLLSQDVVPCVAAVCLLLWLFSLPGNGRDASGDHPDAVSR